MSPQHCGHCPVHLHRSRSLAVNSIAVPHRPHRSRRSEHGALMAGSADCGM